LVDLAQLLEKAVRSFDPHAPTIDEAEMERAWEDSLCHQLAAAEAAFRLHHRAQGAQLSVVEPPSPLALALAARRKAPKKPLESESSPPHLGALTADPLNLQLRPCRSHVMGVAVPSAFDEMALIAA